MTDKIIILMKTTAGELITGTLLNVNYEFVGDRISVTDDEIVLENPHIIFFDDKRQLGMAPYLPLFGSSSLPFNKLAVDVYGLVNDQVYQSYMHSISGLELPTQPKLILENN